MPKSQATTDLDQMVEEMRMLVPAGDDADKVAQLAALEKLQASAAAAIARVSTEFLESQRDRQRDLGVPSHRRGRDTADQIALARRISPSQASRDLKFARALRDDLPVTADLLAAGEISERVARAVHRETDHLSADQRSAIDREVARRLPGLSVKEASAAAKRAAYQADPASAVKRAAKAAKDRRVWTKPAPDTMCTVTALLTAAQGIAVWATLRRDAQALIASGAAGDRTLDQVMADLFVERLTGQSVASAVPVEIHLVMTLAMLFGAQPDGAAYGQGVETDPDGAAWLEGYGPIPAAVARAAIAGVPDLLGPTPQELDRGQAWIRRLFVDPATGQLISADKRRRRFDGAVRRFINLRDRVCRMPFCDAPIRDHDHLVPYRDGGETSVDNGAGVCQRFNQIKNLPGWTTEVIHGAAEADAPPGEHPHTIRITTPTGAVYYSTAPPVPGTRPARPKPPTSTVDVQFPSGLRLAS
ncbi:DUF222 domain-containing protein [Calidifontibacter sp. DB0510]|uniref:DUF222 domain-containing protein n=1 Tax=Metallococcus carri TaxID=1656884 RepID=A0A967B0V1_9MICO|nr:HNH endonuclease signature motif containing protein [Metallococcus carri]NHN56002.1 DUF222 domain-containing protein [Metallococcus carri]NOP37541.1 DUF222 domain-containing protein [Calidifontibacter sp. DB2511S]